MTKHFAIYPQRLASPMPILGKDFGDAALSIKEQSASKLRRRTMVRTALALLLALTGFASTATTKAQTIYEADALANAIEGAAKVEACGGCLDGKRVGLIGNGNDNYLRIKGITVPSTGIYQVKLFYTNGTSGGPRSFTIQINNGPGPTLNNLTGNDWESPAEPVIFSANFVAGNANSVGFFNATNAAPNVDHIEISPGPVNPAIISTTLLSTVYEGDAPGNTLTGAVKVEDCAGCLDGKRISQLGNGSGNALRINNISVPANGTYSVTLYYVNGTDGGSRSLDINSSDGSMLTLNNLTGSSWEAPSEPVTFLESFTAGNNNSLSFSDAGQAPNVDHIVVSGYKSGAPDVSGGNTSTPPIPDIHSFQPLKESIVSDFVPHGKCWQYSTCDYTVVDKVSKWESPVVGQLNWFRDTFDKSKEVIGSTPSQCLPVFFLVSTSRKILPLTLSSQYRSPSLI